MFSRVVASSIVFGLVQVEAGISCQEVLQFGESIKCNHKYYHDKWKQLGRSVVWMLNSQCTAWKFSEYLYATAKHCDNTDDELVFDWDCHCGDYDCPMPTRSSKRCSATRVRTGGDTWRRDDWALWEVSSDCEANESRAIIPVGNASDVTANNKIVLIHHPRGRSKIITEDSSCKIEDSNWSKNTIQCGNESPAEGGSSGGPLLRERPNGEIVVIGINQSVHPDCSELYTVPVDVLENDLGAQKYECARFFEHTNGKGSHFSMEVDMNGSKSHEIILSSMWNDRISSLYVKPFCRVTAYKHWNGGENWTFKHYALPAIKVNMTWFSFNDHITSIKCSCDFSDYYVNYSWTAVYGSSRRLEQDTIMVKPDPVAPEEVDAEQTPADNAVLARLLDGEEATGEESGDAIAKEISGEPRREGAVLSKAEDAPEALEIEEPAGEGALKGNVPVVE